MSQRENTWLKIKIKKGGGRQRRRGRIAREGEEGKGRKGKRWKGRGWQGREERKGVTRKGRKGRGAREGGGEGEVTKWRETMRRIDGWMRRGRKGRWEG